MNLHYVDELIAARQAQHGGGRGAPRIIGNARIGTSINRSIIVMLSAILQSHIEDVFEECARQALPALADDQNFEKYWKQMKNWGNPNPLNVTNLFIKIGVPNIFENLNWQKTTTETITKKLNTINQLRNSIAHGSKELKVDNIKYSLRLANAIRFRNFSEKHGEKFRVHALEKMA
jgi:RiboL-PSP-HEPN